MKTRWAIAAGAVLALLGARAATAAEPAAGLAVTPTVEASETVACSEAAAASEEFSFALNNNEEQKCEDYGFFAADKKGDCEKACKKGRKCVKKERCGDVGCPEPGYCWKCG
jgi:hypothetical protein